MRALYELRRVDAIRCSGHFQTEDTHIDLQASHHSTKLTEGPFGSVDSIIRVLLDRLGTNFLFITTYMLRLHVK